MKYQIEAIVVFLLFSSSMHHDNHFHMLVLVEQLIQQLIHGIAICNFHCIWVPFKLVTMSTSLLDATIKLVMHHPMFVHYAMLLIVRLSSLFVCFFSNRRRR